MPEPYLHRYAKILHLTLTGSQAVLAASEAHVSELDSYEFGTIAEGAITPPGASSTLLIEV